MAGTAQLSTYLPDRQPTWLELLLAALVLPRVVWGLYGGPHTSWLAIGVGVLVFALALGPVANTVLGGRVDRWFRGLGVAGRAVVIVLFAVAVYVAVWVGAVPEQWLADVGTGGLLAVLGYLAAFVTVSGGVSGWWARPEQAE